MFSTQLADNYVVVFSRSKTSVVEGSFRCRLNSHVSMDVLRTRLHSKKRMVAALSGKFGPSHIPVRRLSTQIYVFQGPTVPVFCFNECPGLRWRRMTSVVFNSVISSGSLNLPLCYCIFVVHTKSLTLMLQGVQSIELRLKECLWYEGVCIVQA